MYIKLANRVTNCYYIVTGSPCIPPQLATCYIVQDVS